ncbi:MAG: hypothetical protein LBR80_17335 [Deltaproteobacteria bacterium]|nr:hypothetical protein [Deltaproteobacteria bacterium]
MSRPKPLDPWSHLRDSFSLAGWAILVIACAVMMIAVLRPSPHTVRNSMRPISLAAFRATLTVPILFAGTARLSPALSRMSADSSPAACLGGRLVILAVAARLRIFSAMLINALEPVA